MNRELVFIKLDHSLANINHHNIAFFGDSSIASDVNVI
jgi:hypothetical protein